MFNAVVLQAWLSAVWLARAKKNPIGTGIMVRMNMFI